MTPEQHDALAGLSAFFEATNIRLSVDEDGATLDLDSVGITVGVYPSSGIDGAWVIQVDTLFEPDGSDGTGARVYLNDEDIYVGVGLRHRGEPS